MAEDTRQAVKTEIAMVSLTIDGRSVTVPKGTTVLQAALALGIHIPFFCWHPKLKSVGACRMCYVEIEKFPKLMVSCATEATDGMVVHTETDQVKQGRRAIIEFILANHPLDCPTCDKGGECDLQNLSFAHGLDDSRFDFRKARFVDEGMTSTFDDLKIGPEIVLNRNRCILCYRCVRANKEAFGEYDLGAYERGNVTQINAAPGEQVDNPFSGNLVEICPVGALTNSDWRYKVRVWLTRTVPSICNFTSSGTNITFYRDAHKNHIYRVTSRCRDDIDDGWLSDITRYGYQVVNSPGRLQQPLVKKDGQQVAATWDEALDLVHERLAGIKDRLGAVCLGGLVSPRLDNRSLYLANKFVRTALHSNNIDFRTDYALLPEDPESYFSRLCVQPFRIADIDDSDVIVVFGSDLIREHPNEYLRIRKACNFGRPQIYSLSPYAVKSADVADLEIAYDPSADEHLISGLCLAAVEMGMVSVDADLLKSKTTLRSSDEAAARCGVDAGDLKIVARALAGGKKITFIVGELIGRSIARESIAAALLNLHHLLRLGSRGQMAVLARYANSRGADMLGLTPRLPASVGDVVSNLWGALPDTEPHNTDAMLALMRKEAIRGLMILGGNPLMQYPDREFARAALERLEFLVVADMFESETTALADVVLPLSSWAEYSGDYINLEGRIQTAHQALSPVGQSRPAYEIVIGLAERFGGDWSDGDQLDQEIAQVLAQSQRAALPDELVEVKAAAEVAEEGFDVPLFVVDDPHHSGYLTERAPSLAAFAGEAYAEMSAELAARCDVGHGDLVRVEAPTGKVILPVRISEWLESDVLLVPRNFSATPVTALQMRKRRVDRVRITKVVD